MSEQASDDRARPLGSTVEARSPAPEPSIEAQPDPQPESESAAPAEPDLAPAAPAEPEPSKPAEPEPEPSAPAEPNLEPAAQSVPAPRPTPRPVPHPGPPPASAPTPPPAGGQPTPEQHHDAPAATPPAATEPLEEPTDPSAWGRVADDGAVFVRTSDGERAVGAYPGATPEEALAYFGRKFDEVAGQIGLLEQRLNAAGLAAKDAETSIDKLRAAVAEAHAVGDLDGLIARLDVLAASAAERKRASDAARAKIRDAARAAKTTLVEEAERLAESADWKVTGDQLRTLLEEWKAAPRLDRKSDDALWKRFSHARTTFDKHRRAHFAELDAERAEAATRKEKLIATAEELKGSTDWGPTASAFRELMNQWKAAGRARRDMEDSLWERFKAAQDAFFTARSEVFSARDSDLQSNLEVKEALLVEADRLLPVTDARSARAAMRGIHDRWEAAGHVPRPQRDRVESHLKRVDDAIRAAEDQQWTSSNPEALARAEATVTQLRASIASLEADAAAARAAGQDAKADKAEADAAARRTWLAEAEKTRVEFSR